MSVADVVVMGLVRTFRVTDDETKEKKSLLKNCLGSCLGSQTQRALQFWIKSLSLFLVTLLYTHGHTTHT